MCFYGATKHENKKRIASVNTIRDVTCSEERRHPRGPRLNVDGVKRETKPSLRHVLFSRCLRLFTGCSLLSNVARVIFSHTLRESTYYVWGDKQKKKKTKPRMLYWPTSIQVRFCVRRAILKQQYGRRWQNWITAEQGLRAKRFKIETD